MRRHKVFSSCKIYIVLVLSLWAPSLLGEVKYHSPTEEIYGYARGEEPVYLTSKDPQFQRLSQLAESVRTELYKYKSISQLNLDEVYLFVESDPQAKDHATHANASVLRLNLPGNPTGIMIYMDYKTLSETSDEALVFIIAHEFGHGFKNMAKRYYFQDKNNGYRLPRFTSEELYGNDRYNSLYDLVETVGYSRTLDRGLFLLYDNTILASLFVRVLELMEFDEEALEVYASGNKFSYPDTYSEMLGDYDSSKEELLAFERKLNSFFTGLLSIEKTDSRLSFSYFVEAKSYDSKLVNQFRSLLLLDEQLRFNKEWSETKTHMIEFILGAVKIYNERYENIDKPSAEEVSRIRYYSEENIADEVGLRIMLSRKVSVFSYAEEVMELLGMSPTQTSICIDEFIKKNVEPPIGGLSFKHPALCSRFFSLSRLEKHWSE
ncbi:MAG: hypothetical protein AB8E15_06150 [Bdellovibrionales bacterium]